MKVRKGKRRKENRKTDKEEENREKTGRENNPALGKSSCGTEAKATKRGIFQKPKIFRDSKRLILKNFLVCEISDIFKIRKNRLVNPHIRIAQLQIISTHGHLVSSTSHTDSF